MSSLVMKFVWSLHSNFMALFMFHVQFYNWAHHWLTTMLQNVLHKHQLSELPLGRIPCSSTYTTASKKWKYQSSKLVTNSTTRQLVTHCIPVLSFEGILEIRNGLLNTHLHPIFFASRPWLVAWNHHCQVRRPTKWWFNLIFNDNI